MRDREAALEVCQAVGTIAALLTLTCAAVEFAIGVNWLGIVVFAVFTLIAVAAVLMILALQRGWFGTYFYTTSGDNQASDNTRTSDRKTP